MRAVLLTGHGGLDKLVYREDVPDPVPGRRDVLVRVGAAGINNTDIWTREGAYGAQDDPATVNGWRREALSFPPHPRSRHRRHRRRSRRRGRRRSSR